MFASAPTATPTQSGEKLPDLGIAPLEHLLVGLTESRAKRLRFTTSVANVGDGPIEVRARRGTGDEWALSQRIHRASGRPLTRPLPGVGLVYQGSREHGHWHIRGFARYELWQLGGQKPVRIYIKRGFCLFDSSAYRRALPAAPRAQVYEREGCGTKSARALTMGVSVGWKDDYYWRIPGQYFDITSVPLGRYRLVAKVDPRNWFRESNERNNTTWVDIRIGERAVEVLRRSPPV